MAMNEIFSSSEIKYVHFQIGVIGTKWILFFLVFAILILKDSLDCSSTLNSDFTCLFYIPLK